MLLPPNVVDKQTNNQDRARKRLERRGILEVTAEYMKQVCRLCEISNDTSQKSVDGTERLCVSKLVRKMELRHKGGIIKNMAWRLKARRDLVENFLNTYDTHYV